MYKSAMAVGKAPGGNLFMTAFMLWMSGSGIHIFSIMITVGALWTPLKGLFSVNTGTGNGLRQRWGRRRGGSLGGRSGGACGRSM